MRKALEPVNGTGEPVVRRVGGGYMLPMAPGEPDAEVFAAQVRDGRQDLEAGEQARPVELIGELPKETTSASSSRRSESGSTPSSPPASRTRTCSTSTRYP